MKVSKLVLCTVHVKSYCDEGEWVGHQATKEPVVGEISGSLDVEDKTENNSALFSCGSKTGNSTGVVASESDEL